MQTMYYTTSNFIRHTGNVVDLGEYRRRMVMAQEGSLAPQPEWEETTHEQTADLTVLPAPRPRRTSRRECRAWVLDACASLGVLVMTVVFTVQIIL